MDIITLKNNHVDRTAIWMCDNCGSTIRSNIQEGNVVEDRQDGSYVSTRCPNCGHINNVSKHLFKIEDSFKKKAAEYYNR